MRDNRQFERDKLCYEQNCQHMRSLNQIMWQVPMIAMTLTGGLWFSVATMKGIDPIARSALLGYSAIANIGLVIMINRVRYVINCYLEKIKSFNLGGYVDASGSAYLRNWMVCTTFSVLMGIGAVFSIVGVCRIVFLDWNPTP